MPGQLLWLLVVIAVAGTVLWGLDQWETMDATFKKLVRVIIIVFVSIYAIFTLYNMLVTMFPRLAHG